MSWHVPPTLPPTWGVIIGRSLTDPVGFFIADWFAVFLVAKGIAIEEGILVFWIPFLAADLGNFSSEAGCRAGSSGVGGPSARPAKP